MFKFRRWVRSLHESCRPGSWLILIVRQRKEKRCEFQFRPKRLWLRSGVSMRPRVSLTDVGRSARAQLASPGSAKEFRSGKWSKESTRCSSLRFLRFCGGRTSRYRQRRDLSRRVRPNEQPKSQIEIQNRSLHAARQLPSCLTFDVRPHRTFRRCEPPRR